MMRLLLIFPASLPRNRKLHSGRFISMMNGYEKVGFPSDVEFGAVGNGGLLYFWN